MKYFSAIPLIDITDASGTTQTYKNILARVSVIPSILENPLVYYSYDIQDGDTPEIVAQKYYGDSYRYWIVLFCNNLMDPQWDWPLNNVALDKFITKKYDRLGFDPYTTVKSYQKVTTQVNSASGETTVNTVEISQQEYNDFVPYSDTFTISNETVSISIERSTQSYYDYEVSLNESKRSIKLLNKNYVQQVENEFKKLLGNK